MQKWILRVLIVFGGLIAMFFVVMLILSGGAKGEGHHDASIVINKPPAEVFPWLTEPEKLTKWLTGLVESKALTEGGLRVGAKSQETVEVGGERTVMEVEVTAVEPPKLLVVRITSEGFVGDSRYTLEQDGSSTKLRYLGDFRYTVFMAKLLEPLITPAAQGKLVQDFERLKVLVESGAEAR
jgi:carbon monoxide dehydrogenase subunit G